MTPQNRGQDFLDQLKKHGRKLKPHASDFVNRATLRQPGAPDRMYQLLDDFLTRHGLSALGSHWVELPLGDAATAVAKILQEELQHGTDRLKPERAAELGHAFVALFAADARFFTNGGWHATQMTWEAGVVGVDSELAGLLWYAEDD